MAPTTTEHSVLVVDDDPDIVLGLEDFLHHDGYHVSVAATCAEALTRARAHHFNAVLLDLGLPDGDGWSVLRSLQDFDPSVPVIILTAYTTADRTVGSLTQGAFAYLTKPYNRDELRAVLQRAVGVQALAAKAEYAEHALTESEERFRSLVESATDAIIVANQQGRIVSWNQAATRLFGYALEEVLGHPLTVLMPERFREAHVQGMARFQATGYARLIGKPVELYGLHKDGTEIPLELSLATWNTKRGTFFSGILRDTSERRRTDEALRASEQRLEHVIRGSNDGFWDGRILEGQPWHDPRTPVWYSPRFKELLGYSDEEFPDRLGSWSSKLHPDDAGRVFAALTDHIEGRRPSYDVEYRLLTKSGDYGWFHARAQLVERDNRGNPVRMAGSLQCISDRKRAEEALQRSEALLRSIVNNSTAVIYAKEANGTYLLVNRRFEQLFDVTADTIRGKTDHDIFPKNIADAFRANDEIVLNSGHALESEECAPHPDGLHTYLSIKVPIMDQAGHPYAMCGISTDITERKRSEDQLRASEERLRMALSASHVGIWDWDVESGRLYWSAGVEALFGLASGTFPGDYSAYLDLIYWEDRGSVLASVAQSLQEHASVRVSHRVVWPDGSLHWLVWSGRICRNPSGIPIRVLGTVHDTSGPG